LVLRQKNLGGEGVDEHTLQKGRGVSCATRGTLAGKKIKREKDNSSATRRSETMKVKNSSAQGVDDVCAREKKQPEPERLHDTESSLRNKPIFKAISHHKGGRELKRRANKLFVKLGGW